MQFVEMTGKQLFAIMEPDELNADQLKTSGVGNECIVRVNLQGDLEVRRPKGWEVVGGLLGDFQHRVTQATGLEWCSPLDENG